jgi:asparagine synthase (glutamine-hydrolysing)
MCGIMGSVNYYFDTNIINDKLGHRGPDERNLYSYQNLQFYHLRLAIQDILSGQQPMILDDQYVLIFNGEIYNHIELREKYNLKCKSNSDTETLLLLFARYNFDILNELDGMFVFAFYDKSKNKLFFARDRAGKKPFYYFVDNNKFIFSSELNALRSILPLEINEKNLSEYLRLGFFYGSNTPYKNVFELKGGETLEFDLDSLVIDKKKWWDIKGFYFKNSQDSFEESIYKTELFLKKGIERRINTSDLEVGTFLSGGIDSGLITSIAASLKSNIKTYTVSFEGKYDEAPLAKLVAQKYDIEHNIISINYNNLNYDIEKIISNYGEPFCDDSLIPSYYICAEAKKNLTVLLNGDGADELFAGYRRYVPYKYFNFFKKPKNLNYISSLILKIIPKTNEKLSHYNYFYRLLEVISSNSELSTYLSSTSDIFENTNYLNSNYYDYANNELINLITSVSLNQISALKKIMLLDFEVILSGALLVKMDIASMASSLEVRSPFLCKELLEYAPSINDNYKIRGKTTKFLLRELSKKYLPTQMVNLPKKGFEVPLKLWVDTKLKNNIYEELLSSNSFHNNFVNQNDIIELVEKKHNISAEKRAKIMWNLFCLDIWYKKVYVQ